MFTRPGLVLAALSLAGFLVVSPRISRACSIAGCGFSYAAPIAGGVLPANAPALVFRPGMISRTDETRVAKVALLAADGSVIPYQVQPDPAAPDHHLVTPSAALQEGGMYRLANLSSCTTGGIESPAWAPFNQTFSVGRAAPLPTSIGTVTVRPSRPMTVEVGHPSLCSAPAPVGAAELELALTTEMESYKAVARWTLKVDGKVEFTSQYGSYEAGQPDRSALRPYTVCGGDHASPWLTAGSHTGELSVHVAGATTDPPPLAFSFEVDCPGDGGAGGVPGTDGGAGGSGGGASGAAGGGTGVSNGGGCAVPGGPSRTPSTWALLALIALMRARWRK